MNHTLRNTPDTRPVVRKMLSADVDASMAILYRWNMKPCLVDTDASDSDQTNIVLPNSFVAEIEGRVVGVASYVVRNAGWAETDALGVDPDCLGLGIGYLLQRARLEEIRSRGLTRVRSETDRPETAHWYVKNFGYSIVGTRKKKPPYFGLTDCDHWTVLELDLREHKEESRRTN
ncbi:MAG: GNAT family N-acetyltransferase [Betaproteobacteria bacterium]